MFEISQQFGFEAAHTLPGRDLDEAGSRCIHGHSYRAEVTLRGTPDQATGMVMDLGAVRRAIAPVREALDHRFLDEVEGLGRPTLENLCRFIWSRLEPALPGLARVAVFRPSEGDRCVFEGAPERPR